MTLLRISIIEFSLSLFTIIFTTILSYICTFCFQLFYVMMSYSCFTLNFQVYIVEHIIRIPDHESSSLPSDLVGIQSPIEELEEHLRLASDNVVRSVGICGMGRIGKTTLATILYKRISHLYDACCFIDDVSNIYQVYGPIGARKQLLSQINDKNLQICNFPKVANLIRSKLRHLKVLIVLDIMQIKLNSWRNQQ